MASEADIIQRESGGNPYIGYGGVDLSKAPRDKYGFPIWEGRMGPQGLSHAAGLHQWEPATWAEAAQALGLTDFSEASQHAAYDYMHAKYGDKPWQASEPKLQPEGEYGGSLHVNVQPHEPQPDPDLIGNALLFGILQNRYPKDEPASVSAGNPILDKILGRGTGASPDGGNAAPQISVPLPLPRTAAPPPAPAQPPPPIAPKPLPALPAPAVPSPPPAVAKTGNDVLDRLLTNMGVVPPRMTDIQEGEAERPVDRYGIPFTGKGPVERMGVGERLGALGSMVTPYIAGGAPGGSAAVSSGLRLPGPFRGEPLPPARIEPPLLAGGEGGLPPPGNRGLGPVEGGAPESMPFTDVNATVAEPHDEPGVGGESAAVRDFRLSAMRDVQDKLFKSWMAAEEYKDRVMTMLKDLPRISAEQKLQIEKYLEWQPGMPRDWVLSPESLKIADEFIRPMIKRAARNFLWLRDQGAIAKGFTHLADMDEDELINGYLHRMTANKQPRGRQSFDPFAGVRPMRQTTPSQKARSFYALQGENGERKLVRIDKGHPPRYGTEVRDQNGTRWKVQRATTEEIEANSDVRYLHDPALASVSNMIETEIARRNVELLRNDILPDLERSGLATTSPQAAKMLGFKQSTAPVLRGHYFEERLANAFDDFYRSPQVISEDIQAALAPLTSINRWAIAAMFTNPIGHMRNVAMDYLLARGELWPIPLGATRHFRDAFNDVRNMTPFYRDVMKAGGSLMGAQAQNRIAYQALLDRAREELTTLPNMDSLAKSTGIWSSAKDMAAHLWNTSQKVMWGFHDMLLLARVREIMAAKKVGIESAVREAERFIADYRVPASVGEGGKIVNLPKPYARALSILMQDRTVSVFGRYHFNKIRALTNTVRDAVNTLAKRGVPMEERVEAGKRLATMLMWSTVMQYGINFVLQKMTGNPYASAHVPGALGIPANAAKVATDLFKRDWGEAGYDFWMGMLSIVSPLPAMVEAGSQFENRDLITGQPISGKQLPLWKQMVQRGAHAAGGLVSPLQDITRIIEGKGSPSLGISLPDPAAVERARNPRIRGEIRRENRSFSREFPLLP